MIDVKKLYFSYTDKPFVENLSLIHILVLMNGLRIPMILRLNIIKQRVSIFCFPVSRSVSRHIDVYKRQRQTRPIWCNTTDTLLPAGYH